MAQIVPDVLPRSASAGERRLHTLLRRLPEDCVAYYEPMVGDRCPDFVVICPDLGLLVIEVKGWRVGDILAADSHTVQVTDHGRAVRQVHPLRQARGYMFALMDRCRVHPAIGPLLRPDGFHENRFLFPFGYFAVLSNITEAQLKRHPGGDLTAVFPEHRVLPRDVVSELERCPDAQSLHDALRPCFVKSWPFPRLNEAQVDALRAIIHPEVILELPLEYGPSHPSPPSSGTTHPPGLTPAVANVHPPTVAAVHPPPPTPPLKVLDLRQENHARAVGDGHRILSGVAGSGKTIILLARARLLARRDPEARILVLCYNVTLASFLRGHLAEHRNVHVCHFDDWAAANRVRRNRQTQESDQALGERLLAALQSDQAPDAGHFDSVLVDEAQDFEASWFRCVLAAMKNPADGDLLIVGDGNQGVYRRGKVSWKALGIQASGRTISGRFHLDRNYRNSREIATLAQAFASYERPADEDTVETLPLEVAKCPRTTGLPPLLLKEAGHQAECSRAVALVQDLLTGRLAGNKLDEPLLPEQIGILYRRIARVDQALFARFLDELQAVAPVCWLNAKDDPQARRRVLEPGVKVQTIHASKGLQYRAVILLWAGDMPYVPPQSQHDAAAERRLFYVGLTRAEDLLMLTASSSDRSAFISEVESVLMQCR
ncbi:MAG: AAA family ATPase [Rhodospirillales bacterium]|nr:AAA family ATPase [Acetobacter sp.]